MNKNNDEDDEREAKNNIIEKNARIKTKEYFNKYKSLTKNNVGNFLEYIGLSEIWSTEEERNLFWEKLIQNSENKEQKFISTRNEVNNKLNTNMNHENSSFNKKLTISLPIENNDLKIIKTKLNNL